EKIVKAETAKRQALATLHQDLGYSAAEALAEAILAAARERSGAPRAPETNTVLGPRRGRKLTAQERKGIARALKTGTSGSQVARNYGVSYPTVHEIKKSLGMVRARPRSPSKGRANRRS